MEIQRLVEVVASLTDGVALFDRGGCQLYSTSTRLPGPKAGREPVERGIQSLFQRLTAREKSSVARSLPVDPRPAQLTVSVGTISYRLRGRFLEPEGRSVGDLVLIVVECFDCARTPTIRPQSQLQLTRREREVALLLARRQTNEEIARALGISAATARHHTERVLRKLGVQTRREVERVLREGVESASDRRG